MARVLLIVPELPQKLGAPYLGQQYIAAALLDAGHEVVCVDLAAVCSTLDEDDAYDAAREFSPDLIGMTIFTYNALTAYALAARLRGLGALLVAGGPHPTILPQEPLDNGFDVSVAGEGERLVVELAQALDDGVRPAGVLRQEPLEDLNALPFPHRSQSCYDPRQYNPDVTVVPGGMMTSRGCPARCTFCANYVTGRAYRWRSAENVIAEMHALASTYGVRHFPFFDDAFTAGKPRLEALCAAIEADPVLRGCTWTCITPGNMVRPRDLEMMRRAGCVAINFGLESGDLDVLKRIGKGVRPERVQASVRAARAAGILTIVNFMFGFPGESAEALARTRHFMDTLAPDTDFFNNRGVLVPFPGTAIYDTHHEEFGFTGWWLDPARIPKEPETIDLFSDPALELDFFGYSPAVRDAIEACVRFKAEHNERRTQRSFAATHR
jgi:anaerobic magnesium-protoporphyrin IX monomethyl ester cyclase